LTTSIIKKTFQSTFNFNCGKTENVGGKQHERAGALNRHTASYYKVYCLVFSATTEHSFSSPEGPAMVVAEGFGIVCGYN
jgi:hypothetical protein